MRRILITVTTLGLLFAIGCNKQTANIPDEKFETPVNTEEQFIANELSKTEEAATEVKTTPPPAPPVRKEITFETIHFGFDKYELTDKTRSLLAKHAQTLKENPGIRLLIEGHCDEWGTIEYNLALGDKRANIAKTYLVNYGISPSRINTISYGKERPVDPAHNEDAWAKNRRADFITIQ